MCNCTRGVRCFASPRNDGERTPADSLEIEKIFRNETSRALATLINSSAISIWRNALQDAFAVALERWYAGDMPDNLRAWLINVGRNKGDQRPALDRISWQAAAVVRALAQRRAARRRRTLPSTMTCCG